MVIIIIIQDCMCLTMPNAINHAQDAFGRIIDGRITSVSGMSKWGRDEWNLFISTCPLSLGLTTMTERCADSRL